MKGVSLHMVLLAKVGRALRASRAPHEESTNDLLTPNGVRETVSRVSGEQIRLFPSNPYGSSTLTRKKRLAEFVGVVHSPASSLSRPSTV